MPLERGEIYIDDSNAHEFAQDRVVNGVTMTRGRIPRDFALDPLGCRSAAPRFDVPIIPRSEWSDRIKRQEDDGTRTSDIISRSGMKPLNQNGTNYCWGNAPVNAMRVLAAMMNEPYADLSPASVCAPIVGYRNNGGYGLNAVQKIFDDGVCTTKTWPANAIDRKYDNAESRADRIKRKFIKWGDVDVSRSGFEKIASGCLRNWLFPIGLNWWSHEVLGVDVTEVSRGVFGLRIYNSHGDGLLVLSESKGTPDDMQICFSATSSPE